MYRNNIRYLANGTTRDNYINLYLSLNSPAEDWEKAVSILRERIEDRYMEPIGLLFAGNDADKIFKNGFAAMALCCLLVETFHQFREGYPETPSNKSTNKSEYSRFLEKQLGFVATEAGDFYDEIRCGILHSAQTKGNSCLTVCAQNTIQVSEDGTMMVDVSGMHMKLSQYFEGYCLGLIDGYDTTLRTNFIRKMDDIARKAEGTTTMAKPEIMASQLLNKISRELSITGQIKPL